MIQDKLRRSEIIYYTKERSGFVEDRGLGLIHIFYGQGAGKTTRAIGLSIRAAGEGLLVDFVQFLKSGSSGEVAIFNKVPNIRYRCPGNHPFIMSKGPNSAHYDHAEQGLKFALEAVERGTHLLVCDEILDTLLFGVLRKEQVKDLMERCRGKVELVMTGRDAPPDFISSADYVTELIEIKHPYYCGARARKGIEY